MIYRMPTTEEAQRAIQIVQQCCCGEGHFYDPECAVRYFTEGHKPDFPLDGNPRNDSKEWRFSGDLGFGGKLYWDWTGGWKAGCYPEDRNEWRDLAVASANDLLKSVNVPWEPPAASLPTPHKMEQTR